MYCKLLAIALSVLLLTVPSVSEAQYQYQQGPQNPLSYGDWNGDFEVNTQDLLAFISALNEVDPVTGDHNPEADLNRDGLWDAGDVALMNKLVSGPRLPELGAWQVYVPSNRLLWDIPAFSPWDLVNGYLYDSYNLIGLEEVANYDPAMFGNQFDNCDWCEQVNPLTPWEKVPGFVFTVNAPFDTFPAFYASARIYDDKSGTSYLAGAYLAPVSGSSQEQILQSLGYDGVITSDMIYYFFEDLSLFPLEIDDGDPLTMEYSYFTGFTFVPESNPFYFNDEDLVVWEPSVIPDSDGDGKVEFTGPPPSPISAPWNSGSDSNAPFIAVGEGFASLLEPVDVRPYPHVEHDDRCVVNQSCGLSFCRISFEWCAPSFPDSPIFHPNYWYEPSSTYHGPRSPPPPVWDYWRWYAQYWETVQSLRLPDSLRYQDCLNVWSCLEVMANKLTPTTSDPSELEDLARCQECMDNSGHLVMPTEYYYSPEGYVTWIKRGICCYCGCTID